ncbi:MAG: imidazoleglycerol-phosphate dehydratase HisB [bacterium]|nr:imidazoleglycerol-phosphate dehydratase HisB [bacterium]
MNRTATIERTTRETSVRVTLTLDGSGNAQVSTGVPFLDHMLELFAKHSLCDLVVTAKGDTHIDDHHTVEDVGLCVGEALAKALGDKAGIERFGFALLPMDEALVEVALDLSGRPFLVFHAAWEQEKIKMFDVTLVEEFWRAVAVRAQMNLHINVRYGKDAHHVSEAIFKGVARALVRAVMHDPRRSGIPSTKGTLSA